MTQFNSFNASSGFYDWLNDAIHKAFLFDEMIHSIQVEVCNLEPKGLHSATYDNGMFRIMEHGKIILETRVASEFLTVATRMLQERCNTNEND